MKPRLSPSDLKLLETCLIKARALEKEMKEAGSSPDLFERTLAELKALIQGLSLSDDPLVQRQAELADHLHPAMSHRHFLNFILPLERLLDRSLSDEDFLITTDDVIKPDLPRRPLVFVLDNLRSAFNVGSIFRMAETLWADSIVLCGYTPGPESQGVRKTAMGTETLVAIRRFDRIEEALGDCSQQGLTTVALETSPQAKSLYEGTLPKNCAFVVGNERFGLDYHTVKACQEARMIPLAGSKNSLNVASALSVAAFEWHRQNLEIL